MSEPFDLAREAEAACCTCSFVVPDGVEHPETCLSHAALALARRAVEAERSACAEYLELVENRIPLAARLLMSRRASKPSGAPPPDATHEEETTDADE
jgi:hypothetical protein